MEQYIKYCILIDFTVSALAGLRAATETFSKNRKKPSNTSFDPGIETGCKCNYRARVTYGPTIVFEGVDYDLLATPIYKEYYDCYYLHTKCVRDQSNFNEVCAYHLVLGWINFATPCEIDLANCLHRMEMGIPMYGGDKKQGGEPKKFSKNREKLSNTSHDLEIEPQTPCPAVALGNEAVTFYILIQYFSKVKEVIVREPNNFNLLITIIIMRTKYTPIEY
ncbi:hypothetical protein SFRURICE_006823, partial [Spodoptera frugiperda]